VETEPNSLTLYPNKKKTLLFILGCAAFVGIILLTIKGPPSWFDWLGIIFFGSGVVVFTINLLPNCTHLKLSEKGFEARTLYRSSFTPWADVELFGAGTAMGNKTVCFAYSAFSPSLKKASKDGVGWLRKLNNTEGIGWLPQTYGMSAEDLAKLLNKWKQKYS
jgi:hypothetical protein